MGAPLGNKFWEQRSKHGRDKLFSSPEVLWEEACKYFDWCEENPLLEETIQILKVNGIGDEMKRVDLAKMHPYTWTGLEYFLDIESLRDYKKNEKYKDFSQVISRIEKIIYTQKFEGAAAGFFNANIISRDLGLADKQEQKQESIVTGKVVIVSPNSTGVPLSNDERDVNLDR